jgi:hypothetical protein
LSKWYGKRWENHCLQQKSTCAPFSFDLVSAHIPAGLWFRFLTKQTTRASYTRRQIMRIACALPQPYSCALSTFPRSAITFHEYVVHDMLSVSYRWPPQCDVTACFRHLRNAYEQARSVNMDETNLLNNSKLPLEVRCNPMDMFKRLGCTDTDMLSWLESARLGNVRFRDKDGYSRTTLHSFTNVPCRSEVLTPGNTSY